MSSLSPATTARLLQGAAVLALLLVAPSLGVGLGDLYARDLVALEGSDQISRWRSARLAYRAARLSPLLWGLAARREDALDQTLADVFLQGTVDGTLPEPDTLLRFLEARQSRPRWHRQLQISRLRFGETDAALADAVEPDIALAAALIAADGDALRAWLPRAPHAPPALLLATGLPLPEDAPPLLRAEALRRSGDADGARALLEPLRTDPTWGPLAWEAWLLTAPPTLPRPADLGDGVAWMGARLALAHLCQQRGDGDCTVEALLSALPAEPLPTLTAYTVLGPPWLPHPDRFTPLLELASGGTADRLRLLQARACLQGLDVAAAQAALKPVEGHDAERLMLRTLAREIAGDLDGALKYAAQGEELPAAADKGRFKLLRARLLLLGAEKEAPLQILSGLSHYPLSELEKAELEELLVIARRISGEPEPFTLAGVQASDQLYIDDAEFRWWFARYMAALTDDPGRTSSKAIAALRYWRAAGSRGKLLLEVRLGDRISPLGELVRTHHQYLRGQLLDGDSSGWERLTRASKLLADEPFRAFLADPTLAAVSISSDAPVPGSK